MIKFSIQFSFSLFGRNWLKRKKTPCRDFIDEAQAVINALTSSRAKSTIGNYRTALCSLRAYLQKPLPIDSLDANIIEGWGRWLRDKDTSPNTISCYMRSLRSLIRKMNLEINVQQLFGNVFTGREVTEKRSLSIEDIRRLQQLQLPRQSPIAFARDLFLFSFYALGMPFVDMAYLRKSQISDGTISYHRHKTGQRICVSLEKPLRQIVRRYQQEDSPYVFPILSTIDHQEAEIMYETARSRYNRLLHRLGQMAEIRRPLTSYVARHSWASTAYHANVSLSVISKALGHASPNTTQTYLQSIDDDQIANANHQLLEYVISKKQFSEKNCS